MTPEDVLPSIAEIAIGLAGFSGLVAAFSQRPGQAWKGDQKARIVFLIILSFGMITSALLPAAMSGVSGSPALVWGVPMVAYSALTLGLLGRWVVLSRRHGYELQFPFVSIPIITAAALLQVAVLLSGLGVIVPYSSTLFVFGLLAVLVFGANMFLALLHITWRDEDW
jgi:hypothetical protein